VDSIEHGSFLDDEALSLMKEKGTYFVPTLLAGHSLAELFGKGVLDPRQERKAKLACLGGKARGFAESGPSQFPANILYTGLLRTIPVPALRFRVFLVESPPELFRCKVVGPSKNRRRY